MDKSAPEITFDETGVCNYCHMAQHEISLSKELRKNVLGMIQDIKQKGGKYDCLIGLSGGVDSSTTLVKAVDAGLKPLCFSVDNGWQDPKADENIMRLVEGLKVPYYKYNVDKSRFIRLQSAFIQAGQKNLEIPTDHILMAKTLEVAAANGIKCILSGGNVNTESIMPASWGYNARDLVHMKDVYHKMRGKPLKGLPVCSLLKWNYYKWVKGIYTVYLLDYFDYNRADSIKMLEERFGYKDYGEKHCESSFTMWFQNYYLFEKFGIDKRKAHLSSLINSGQITREEALHELTKSPVYPDLEIDCVKYKKRPYTDFKTDEKLYLFISKIIKIWKS